MRQEAAHEVLLNFVATKHSRRRRQQQQQQQQQQ